METLLYSNPSIESMWALLIVKFKLLFVKLTGYDLMFEASKKDIELTKGTKNNTVEQSSYTWPSDNGEP